ncbi:MAG: thioredoxin family protein [Desulfosarcina sp.]|nr:thioredoxin family protein [Desulfobacterales bacterium]
MNLKTMRMALLILLICLISCNAYSDKIHWYSYDEGLELAKTENKKVFLHFWASWCGYCTKMATQTFNDSSVADYLNTNFIPIKINTDKKKNLALKYKVRGLPDTWFLTDKGENITNLAGYIPPDRLLPVLKYIFTDSYKTQNFNNFMSKD